jgi:hypothetical protein
LSKNYTEEQIKEYKNFDLDELNRKLTNKKRFKEVI